MSEIKTCFLCGDKKIICFDKEINLSICRNCGYIFVDPMPTKSEIKEYYSNNDNYDWWLKREKGFDQLSERRLGIILDYKNHGDLLDVGAGIGQFLNFAKKSFQVVGTEVATSAIKIAKDKYEVKLLEGEVEEMPFSSQKFDVITIFHVLEHVHNPGLLLSKCKSLLKKDGIIVIAVPNDIDKFLKRRLKQVLKMLKIGRFQRYGTSGLEGLDIKKQVGEVHLSQFRQKSLRKYFSDHSYEILAESLDPYFVGISLKDRLKYSFFSGVKKVTGLNLYDTMLYVVRDK